MFAELKDALKTREVVTEIDSKLKESAKEIKHMKSDFEAVKSELSSLKKEISQVNKKQSEMISLFEDNIKLVKVAREELEKEINDFKTLKGRVLKDVTSDMAFAFKKDLQDYTQKLKLEIGEYDKIKSQMVSSLNKTQEMNDNIKKLAEVVSNIKKEDFELSKFAGRLLAEDKNKLELMNRIDNLERMIGKLRRNSQ